MGGVADVAEELKVSRQTVYTKTVVDGTGVGRSPFQTFLTILQGFESINLAFANSGITNKNVRLRVENFAFNGFKQAGELAGEAKNPGRSLPIASLRAKPSSADGLGFSLNAPTSLLTSARREGPSL